MKHALALDGLNPHQRGNDLQQCGRQDGLEALALSAGALQRKDTIVPLYLSCNAAVLDYQLYQDTPRGEGCWEGAGEWGEVRDSCWRLCLYLKLPLHLVQNARILLSYSH